MLHCSECDKLFHPDCVVPPVTDLPSEAWICYSCKEKTEEYIQARRVYIAELQKRSVILNSNMCLNFPFCIISCSYNGSKVYTCFFLRVVIHFVRYEAALERKIKILEIIRSLNLPNNPLDDIVDQVTIITSLIFVGMKQLVVIGESPLFYGKSVMWMVLSGIGESFIQVMAVRVR